MPDLNGALNDAAVSLRHCGLPPACRTKVLEAMAAGRPVDLRQALTTRGWSAQPGRDLLIADDTGTIANQIVALLQDADLASASLRPGERSSQVASPGRGQPAHAGRRAAGTSDQNGDIPLTVRFGLIGCGRVAPANAQSIQQIHEASLVAVADVKPSRADHFSSE